MQIVSGFITKNKYIYKYLGETESNTLFKNRQHIYKSDRTYILYEKKIFFLQNLSSNPRQNIFLTLLFNQPPPGSINGNNCNDTPRT
jgi:hypothetical protein